MIRRLSTAAAAFVTVACSPSDRSGELVRVTVPHGASVDIVTDTLVARGVIESPTTFRLYVKLTGNERTIRAGVYDLPVDAPFRLVVRSLVRGQTAQDRLVLPEGLMISEIATFVEHQLGIPSDSLRAAARDTVLARRLGTREPTLEGYLYPSTYHVEVGATAHDVVRQMVAEFEARWEPEWNARLDSLGLSRDELVTLASIIEAEVLDPADRFYVSSVYHNRLARGMRLEADPTVIYALGERRRLLNRDYRTRSPYNTYLISGLPPHAIGQPSAASVEAALYPRTSDFLFFVAGPGGKHIFSRSFAEHRAAIRQIRDPDGTGSR